MLLFLLSFIAGILTVLAPCVLPLLPVIIGSSAVGKNKYRPYWVILGLMISVALFTVLIKASTLLIDIDPKFWSNVSGGILIVFGLFYVFPKVWDRINVTLKLSSKSDKLLDETNEKEGVIGAILLGGALGPVFSSCSPTYALIIATILPVSFWQGMLYILAYVLGLGFIMLLIALLGRKLVTKLNVVADPNGLFKKVIGFLLILVGVLVIFGIDKQIETAIISGGGVDWLIDLEVNWIDNFNL